MTKGMIAYKAYHNGMDDAQIAKEIGVLPHYICSWRKINGLAPNTHLKNYEPEIYAMLAEGQKKAKIAEKLGLYKNDIYCWGTLSKNEKAKELYDLGYSDAEIGERIGKTQAYVSRWRKVSGRNCRPKHGNKSKLVLKYYNEGHNDVEIARMTGIFSVREITEWRNVNGLVANHLDKPKKWYTIYREKDDTVVANGTRESCARQMGVAVKTIEEYVCRAKHGDFMYAVVEETI